MAGHDESYKQLFSHGAMVADLLRGFVHEPWVAELDFATLEKVNASYVSDDLRKRDDDVVWRVRWGPRWLYVYVVIEFQSEVDRYMAVRLLAYLGLLYQDLIKSGGVAVRLDRSWRKGTSPASRRRGAGAEWTCAGRTSSARRWPFRGLSTPGRAMRHTRSAAGGLNQASDTDAAGSRSRRQA